MRLCLAALAGILSALPVWAQDPQVPFDGSYPPLSFVDADGTPDGFDVAVAREIATQLGITPEFVSSDFDTIQSGDWPENWLFTVSSMSRSPAREERFFFVGPYYQDATVIVTGPNTSPDAEPTLDLVDGGRIGVCRGCIYQDYIEGNYVVNGQAGEPPFADVAVTAYSTDTDILLQLIAAPDEAEIDFGVTSVFVADLFKASGFPIRKVGSPLFVEPLWIAVPLSKESELARIEEAFEAVRASGRLSELSVQHLQNDYTPPAPPVDGG